MAKILVIEDEAILREEIVGWLMLEGYTVLDAENGLNGVELACRHMPDLIVCDILMPHLDGYGVLLDVRADPKTVGIPFIFLTAKAAHDDIRKGMELGADDYITKPFTRLELLQAIQARLSKKNTQTQQHQFEIKQLQEALMQATEHGLLKAKLIAMFSHGFANSLTSVLLTSNLMRTYQDTLESTRRLTHLMRIEASTRLLLQMLDDLMIIAQMEKGSLDLAPTVVNVSKLFQRIQEDAQAIYGVHYQILFEYPKENIVLTNAQLLRLIINNLLTYITKFAPQGSTVSVKLEHCVEECILTIQDYGVGLPEAECRRIADALQERSAMDTLSVIGLELAIVKQAVILQKGSIQFNPQSGVSTTVTVRIPFQQDEVVVTN